jgi:hypothetical protein
LIPLRNMLADDRSGVGFMKDERVLLFGPPKGGDAARKPLRALC